MNLTNLPLQLPGSELLRQVRNLIEQVISRPRPLPTYADPTALNADYPASASNAAIQVFVTSLSMVAVSNGTNWKRLDTGATI